MSLEPSDDLLARLHHGVQFSRHHDGQALVLGQRQLNVGPRLLHDVQAQLGLLPLSKLAVVLVPALFQRDVKHLQREKGGGETSAEGKRETERGGREGKRKNRKEGKKNRE